MEYLKILDLILNKLKLLKNKNWRIIKLSAGNYNQKYSSWKKREHN